MEDYSQEDTDDLEIYSVPIVEKVNPTLYVNPNAVYVIRVKRRWFRGWIVELDLGVRKVVIDHLFKNQQSAQMEAEVLAMRINDF